MFNQLLLVACATLATFGKTTAFPAAAQASSCASGVHVIVARGTTEPQGQGFEAIAVQAILKRVPGSDAVSVVYPASFDIGPSEAAGVKNMTKLVEDYAAACPNSKMVLMGYSQGAQVTGDVVSGGGSITPTGQPSPATPPLPASAGQKLAAIILFGDPNRQGGQPYDKDTCKNSATHPRTNQLASKFNSYSSIIQSYCNAGDPVCCSSGNNFLAHLSYFTQTRANDIATFVASKVGA